MYKDKQRKKYSTSFFMKAVQGCECPTYMKVTMPSTFFLMNREVQATGKQGFSISSTKNQALKGCMRILRKSKEGLAQR